VRISSFYECDATLEVFSYLRFVHASGAADGSDGGGGGGGGNGNGSGGGADGAGAAADARVPVAPSSDLARCPRAMDEERLDLSRRPIAPLSRANEAAALDALGALARGALAAHAAPGASADDDAAALAAERPFSNRRNALVLLAGERAVARALARIAREGAALLRAPDAARAAADARAAAAAGDAAGAGRACEDRDVARYLRLVVVPLLDADAARAAAGLAKT